MFFYLLKIFLYSKFYVTNECPSNASIYCLVMAYKRVRGFCVVHLFP